jgi:hypothetical protein
MSSESSPHNREWNWPVVGGIIVSTFFLCATLAPFLFVPTESNNWLQNLGNVGQLVSGLFAPLAFVWVVVAVILQSRELKLQREELMLTREELKNTREVFELQKEEMTRAADENREQTRIMNENLQREGERQIYTEADILLYSLTPYMASNRDKVTVQGFGPLLRLHTNFVASLNKNNSDGAYPLIRNGFEEFQRYSSGRPHLLQDEIGGLDYCRNQIAVLCENEKFTSNRLVATRVESLGLKQIFGLLRAIKAH